jgi:DNA modification methylase
VIGRLQKDFYSTVVTSPPYFWQRDYGVEGQLGLEEKVDEYVASLESVMDEVKRVLHPKGVLFLNLGDTYYSGKGHPKGNDRKHNGRRFPTIRAVDKSGLGYPKKTLLGMPWRVALAMIDRKWILRSSIIWRRENAVPEPNVKDRPRRTFEYVFLFTKTRWYEFDRSPLAQVGEEDVWTIESQSQHGREHPAVFPPQLVSRCLALGNPGGGPVLDPFAGSGTVLKVAGDKSMDSVGIELNKNYCASMISDLQSRSESASLKPSILP